MRFLFALLSLALSAVAPAAQAPVSPPPSATNIVGILAAANGGSGIANSFTASWTGWSGNDSVPGLGQANTFTAGNSFTAGLAVSTSGSTHALTVTDTGSSGSNLKIVGNGASTPSKTFRVNTGKLQLANDAYSAIIWTVDDSGNQTLPATITVAQSVGTGVTSTATAAGTTALSATSTQLQIFTGSSTQTVTLPAAAMFGAGLAAHFVLINRSSGSVSWARSGSDTINGGTSSVAVTTNTVSLIWSDGVSAWYTK
jgi:hypothetical protein